MTTIVQFAVNLLFEAHQAQGCQNLFLLSPDWKTKQILDEFVTITNYCFKLLSIESEASFSVNYYL